MKPFKNYILPLLLLLAFASGKAQVIHNRAFGTAGWDAAYDIIITHDNFYMLLGQHQDNLYIAKADTNAQLVWEKSYYSSVEWPQQPNSICEIGDSSYVIAGVTEDKGYLFKINSVGDTLFSITDTNIVGNNISNLRQAPDGNLLALVTHYGIVSLLKFDNNLNVIARIDSLTPPFLRGIEVVNNTIYILKRDSINNLLLINNDFTQIDSVTVPIKVPVYLKKSFDNTELILEGVDTAVVFAPHKMVYVDIFGNTNSICDTTGFGWQNKEDFNPIDNLNNWVFCSTYTDATWGPDIRLYFTDDCGGVLKDTILYRGGSFSEPWAEEALIKMLVDHNGNYVLYGRAEQGPIGDWDLFLWIYKKWDGFITAVEETENQLSLFKNSPMVYPNPTQNQFTVSGITENSSITVLDVMGKVVYTIQHTSPNTHHPISTTNWAKGLYVVQIKGNSATTSLKVVKQ